MKTHDTPSVPPGPAPDAQLKLAQMALLGHDLRAAVADILAALRLVSRERLDDAARRQIERVRIASDLTARLLDEGLVLVAAEAEAVGAQQVQTARLLRELEIRWSGHARERGITLQLTLAPDMPPVLVVDRLALDRAVSNLLSNAFKYARRGMVQVSFRLTPGGFLQIRVRDDGPGFPPELLGRLLEPGQRGSTPNRPGYGLGLAIARDMAERLGGRIELHNRPGGGATVTLIVPMLSTLPLLVEEGQALPDLSGLRILVADDSRTHQAVICHMLDDMGATCITADHGREALALLAARDYDLAVIDIEMPELDGRGVIAALRASEAQRRLPVLACTADARPETREALLAMGADAVVLKPLISIPRFAAAVERALQRDPRPQPEPAKTDPGFVDGLLIVDATRFARLLAIAGEDGGRELLHRLLADLRGIDARLRAALAGTDAAAIRREMHILTAISGELGAQSLYDCAAALGSGLRKGRAETTALLGHAVCERIAQLIAFTANELSAREDRAGECP